MLGWSAPSTMRSGRRSAQTKPVSLKIGCSPAIGRRSTCRRAQALLLALRRFLSDGCRSRPPTEPRTLLRFRRRPMSAQPATLNGRWPGFRTVNGDDAAANAAATDLINILDTVDVPIVVVRRDLMIAGFNKAAADMLRLSPPTLVGRPAMIRFSLACLVWKSNAARSSQAEWNPGSIFATGTGASLFGYLPSQGGDRQVTGAVLTFTNVTAFRAEHRSGHLRTRMRQGHPQHDRRSCSSY